MVSSRRLAKVSAAAVIAATIFSVSIVPDTDTDTGRSRRSVVVLASSSNLQTTLALIKPDVASRDNGALAKSIIEKIHGQGFRILDVQTRTLSLKQAKALYGKGAGWVAMIRGNE